MATWRPPAGFVALAVVAIAVGGIVNMVHEGQKGAAGACAGGIDLARLLFCALFLTLLFAALACASQVMRQAVYEDIKSSGGDKYEISQNMQHRRSSQHSITTLALALTHF